MASPVRRIKISAFRGISKPLELDFEKNGHVRSMVIYGRNGTGKSSVTDAVEWFHKGHVDHLRREGAGADSYPHRDADPDNTHVEVEFTKDELDSVRLSFNPNRKTMPKEHGDIDEFREIAPHPFYIRFEDLKEFVYQTKTEKYDRLARLMGFEPQVEFQRSLQRTLNKLEGKLEDRKRLADQCRSDLEGFLELSSISEMSLPEVLQERLKRNGLDPAETVDELEQACESLKEQVENNPRAKRINQLSQIGELLEQVAQPDGHMESLRRWANESRNLADQERTASDVLLLNLYEAGEEILSPDPDSGLAGDHCPLCHQRYEGDLLDHIRSELGELRTLRAVRESLDEARTIAERTVRELCQLSDYFNEKVDSSFEADGISVDSLQNEAQQVEEIAGDLEAMLDDPIDTVTGEHVSELEGHVKTLEKCLKNFEQERESLLTALKKQKEVLEEESNRAQLVDDYNKVRDALDKWKQWRATKTEKDRLQEVYTYFRDIVDQYVKHNVSDVTKRFGEISEDVQTYFESLEEDTEGLYRPRLKLISDKDRAVTLEVEFHGESTSPAYKYLSESQLNSFGLAVFLASAKRFNDEFKFIILDDVVNSLDGYKRPKLIRLINNELEDHQFIIMTHDNVWRDRLFEKFSHWNRVQFTKWKPGVGPIKEKGKTKLEEVDNSIRKDKPVIAGRILGPYIERRLRRFCEHMGAKVPYERNPKYSLDRLLNSLISRIKSTLGKDSDIYEALLYFKEEQKFRNLCAHGVTPSIQISSGEMRSAYSSWMDVENILVCDREECDGRINYKGDENHFECGCGSNVIE